MYIEHYHQNFHICSPYVISLTSLDIIAMLVAMVISGLLNVCAAMYELECIQGLLRNYRNRKKILIFCRAAMHFVLGLCKFLLKKCQKLGNDCVCNPVSLCMVTPFSTKANSLMLKYNLSL